MDYIQSRNFRSFYFHTGNLYSANIGVSKNFSCENHASQEIHKIPLK